MQIKFNDNITLTIDEEDFDRLSGLKIRKYLNRKGGKYYYAFNVKSKIVWVHRFIMNCSVGDGIQIDHKNGDPSDNRKCNLRVCLKGKYNAINRPKQKNNTTGYKGVFRKNGSYAACIRVDQKLKHIGMFETPEEAALAYNQKALEYFGEFAYLNEIQENN